MSSVSYTPLTPLSFLERSAYVFPEKTAVVDGGTRLTYGELAHRVNRLASALRSAGIGKGDRVAFLSPNTPPLLDAHYGVPLAGGVLVAINIRLAPREIAYILNHSASKILFVDAELAHLIEPVAGQLSTVKTTVSLVGAGQTGRLAGPEYEEFLRGGDGEPVRPILQDENDIMTINYTSGTTGLPKGVTYAHRGAYLNALGEALETGMDSSAVYLWTLPMFHCNGWCFTWAVTAVGGTHVCLRKVDPQEVLRLIEEESVTHLCAAPTVLISLSHDPRARKLTLSRKLRIMAAGAPPAPEVIRKIEEMGAEVVHLYGLTETYGPHSICEWQPQWDGLSREEQARIKSRQGVPYITAVDMRVVDGEMRDVPRDGATPGEVVMRGNNVMAGYFEDPDATETAFRGGWFHSGDVAVVHPDGYIEIRDRKKDVIISGGENISSVEVEKVLYEHPGVLEVAVVGIPDEKWGEVPKAFITPKSGANLTVEEVIGFCRERLAHFKCPKVVEFCELPKTATGKVKKYELRESEWKGYDKRVH